MSGYSLRTAKSTDAIQIQIVGEQREKPFTDEYKREMGRNLKALRNAKGLTVERAAELFGASGGTIKEFERGNSLTNDNMIELCRLYGCSIGDFYPEALLGYLRPVDGTLKKMDSRDLVKLMSLASQELCRRQSIS